MTGAPHADPTADRPGVLGRAVRDVLARHALRHGPFAGRTRETHRP